MRVALTTLAALSFSLPAAAQALHPGLWELKMRFSKLVMFGHPAPDLQKHNEQKPQLQCVSPEDAYLNKLVDKIGSKCKLIRDDLTGTELHLKASCQPPQGSANSHPSGSMVVALDGPYTPEAVKFHVDIVGTMGGTPIEMAGDLDAHRVSMCPIPKAAPDLGK